MATHRIGKFKFNLSKHGVAFRWGEGEIRRIPFGRDGGGYDGQPEYEGGADHPYEEGAYYDDRAGDDSDYRADDYDDSYGDYYEEDGYYAEGDDGYYEQGEPRQQAGPVMEYIENNPWAALALLVVLPPLGIYLLWRFNRFEFKMRAGISAASAVWFIVLLVLLFSGLFGGSGDTTTPPQMTLTTIAPTVEPSVDPIETAEPDATAEVTVDPNVSPSPTPLAGLGDVNTGDTGDLGNTGADDTELVYSPQTGLYYHSDTQCANIDTGVSLTRMTVAAAKLQNKSACPLCIGGATVYYGTRDGRYYHTVRTCSGMQNAVEYTKAAAEGEGKTACPVCAGGTRTTDTNDNRTSVQKYFDGIRNDKSGIDVYMTTNGKYYHTQSSCSGMSGARKVSLLQALQSGKSGCPTCADGSNKRVYATESGKWYHTDQTCQGMQNARSVTLAAALVLGKQKCPVCISDNFYQGGAEDTGDTGGVSVYATANGRYYHTNATCSGMTNASKVSLQSMLQEGRPACPVCTSSAEKVVYASAGGKHFHSYATCSGMTNAKSGSLAQALAYGYTACPNCWGTSSAPGGEEEIVDRNDGNTGYSGVYVYATEEGRNYHIKQDCSQAESGVTRVLLEQAIDDGKTPCSNCASIANDKVYATRDGKYYHKNSTCSGMTNAKSGTLANALAYGYTACPVCYGSSEETPASGKYKAGTSGIKVYATTAGRYYHTKSGCSRISGSASHIALETALNSGKTPCPTCADGVDRTVYATKGGKYFHYSSSCAGSSAAKGTLDVALALGLEPCPNCVTGTGEAQTPAAKFTPGKSGIKVYGLASGTYYHNKSDCGGMTGAQYVTLELALNHGLKACPDCAAASGRTVYAVSGSNTYHIDKSCAGSGAKSGTLAEALAYGMKACPICVTGESSEEEDGGGNGESEGAAPSDTTVYVDISADPNGALYHRSATCAETSFSGGTPITLKFALNHGYGDCGFCNPPTSLSD
ncbi:MAG: hypothetical protein ACOYI5_00980 [Christensenellales bacterium]|jgi:hypothetical protein